MKSPTSHSKLTGELVALNISPKGMYESMLVKDGSKVVQINFGPKEGKDISHRVRKGEKATFEVEPEEFDKPSDHPVYKLIALDAGKPDAKADHGEVTVEGKIVQLNYALHGEINGAILDNGDFVHLKPEGAKSAKLSLGQKLTVCGKVFFLYYANSLR